MKQQMLDYLLKETEVAVRTMCRDGSMLHVFDVGRGEVNGNIVELSMLMWVAPKGSVDYLLHSLTASLPGAFVAPTKPLDLTPADPPQAGGDNKEKGDVR